MRAYHAMASGQRLMVRSGPSSLTVRMMLSIGVASMASLKDQCLSQTFNRCGLEGTDAFRELCVTAHPMKYSLSLLPRCALSEGMYDVANKKSYICFVSDASQTALIFANADIDRSHQTWHQIPQKRSGRLCTTC